ncbi:MAG: hypothetical protein KDD41_12920 [Flavobacteriales bacterium]|nr:hypothetical protein [Flavobacteriales bacterium]
MSNIFENITFTSDKPATYLVHKSDTVTYLAIGLLKNQLLKEHQTAFPALLTVLKGHIEFRINGEKFRLSELDTYSIPVNQLHEVAGLDEQNIFTLIIERS